MALELVGVQLVADEADAYISKIAGADKATVGLGKSAIATADAVNTSSGAYVDASGRLRDASGKFIKAGDDMAEGAKKAADGVGVLDRIVTGAAHKIGAGLVDAAADAGRAIVDFAVTGVAKAGDFEAKMGEFASVAGGALDDSGKSVEDFAQLFIKMGRELPVSTADVQQAAIEMAKGGIEPATIAAGGLRTALDLAAASGVGIADSAEILSKQLGVWVDGAASAAEKSQFLAQAANLISQAANASTVNVDDLALGLANTGKSADIAGLSFKETVTSMALISAGFSSAADAGTSFKTFVARLTPVTDTQAEAFKKLNLLTAEGKSVFYDTSGSFIGMEAASGILQKSLAGLSEEQRKTALEAAFGADAIRAAGMLADAGAEGYQHMAEEMAKVGSVARQAAARQQGFNVAVDNVMGSLEAFQIVAARKVLPVLTNLANALAAGINMLTDYVDATAKGETALSTVASVISDGFLPALAGLGTAVVVYAAVQAPAMIAAATTATTAFIAQAAAVAAAAAPFVVVGAAVAGVVLVINQLNNAVASQTQQLLESRQWWLDSGAAVESYALQTDAARVTLEPYAATIEAIRTQIQGEIEDLGKRMAAGQVSEEQYAAEMAAINTHKEGLVQATLAYNAQEQALVNTAAASATATVKLADMSGAVATVGGAASLTAKDVADLNKVIEDTLAKGQEAVEAYATTQSEFLSGVEQRQSDHKDKIASLEAEKQKAQTEEEKAGIDKRIAQENESYSQQELNAAQAYAKQQAAQQKHLGQMLIDYTLAQASLQNISKEKAAEITAALEKEYGLQETSMATTFLRMAGTIDKYAKDSSGSIDGLIGELHNQEDQAADTQHAMDSYAKNYVATATNNFLANKADADAYILTLNAAPKNIVINVTTRYSEETVSGRRRGGDQGDDPEGRASGGPVDAGTPYLVGERGPELIVPTHDATVIPAPETRRAMSGSQLSGIGSQTTIYNTSTKNVSMPVYTNETPAVIEQSAAIVWAMM